MKEDTDPLEVELTAQQCVPCRKGEKPLQREEMARLSAKLNGWELVEVYGVIQLKKVYEFNEYLPASDFVQRVAQIADAQDHHPEILLQWGKVTIHWWTHIVSGLHMNDFISAAKTDELYAQF